MARLLKPLPISGTRVRVVGGPAKGRPPPHDHTKNRRRFFGPHNPHSHLEVAS